MLWHVTLVDIPVKPLTVNVSKIVSYADGYSDHFQNWILLIPKTHAILCRDETRGAIEFGMKTGVSERDPDAFGMGSIWPPVKDGGCQCSWGGKYKQ